MHSKLTEEDLKTIYNVDGYSNKVRKEMVEGLPVAKIYKGIDWYSVNYGIEELQKNGYLDERSYYYAVFNKPILQLTLDEIDGDTKLCFTRSYDSETPPRVFDDLKEMKRTAYL
jgi:hypothetical protein